MPPPPSSIFEVLSGQGTLSLGLSLSSVCSSVCVRVQFLWTLLAEGTALEEESV